MLRLPLWSSGWVTPRVASDVNPQSWGTFPTASTQQRSAAAGPAFIDCPAPWGLREKIGFRAGGKVRRREFWKLALETLC